MSSWTPEELANWEKLSTENMIVYYRDELKLISEGTRAHTLLSKSLIKRLLDKQILINGRGRRAGRTVTLSEKGKRLIGISEIET